MPRPSRSHLLAAKKTWMGGASPAMTEVGSDDRDSFRGLRGGRAAEIHHRERGVDALGGAVLKADHGVDGDVALAAIDRVDDAGVFLVDDAAPDFSGASELAVVCVEFLVEQQ